MHQSKVISPGLLLLLRKESDSIFDQHLILWVLDFTDFFVSFQNICNELIFFEGVLFIDGLRFEWVLLHVVDHLLLGRGQSFVYDELGLSHIFDDFKKVDLFGEFWSAVVVSRIELVILLNLFPAWLGSSETANSTKTCTTERPNKLLRRLEAEQFQMLRVAKRQNRLTLDGQSVDLVSESIFGWVI